MANLLIYLDAECLQRMLPIRRRGAVWSMHASDFRDDELERLDEQSALFVVTLEAGRAVLVAHLEGATADRLGDATVCGDDITHLLPRLGCVGPEDLPAWANLPRVLPPGDVDLLLSRPPPAEAFSLPPPPPPPPPPALAGIVAADPIAVRLLAAIYEDLGSDAARMVYADHLQDQGDPRGELIALQLAKQPVPSELYARCASACVGPLAPYLRPGFVLRRGFLAECVVVDQPLPDAIVSDIAWSTVEVLHARSDALLRSPTLVSAWRVGLCGDELMAATRRARQLPFEVITGYHAGPQLGPAIDAPGLTWIDALDALIDVPVLVRLRAISVDSSQFPPRRARQLLARGLGKQLRHLDVSLGATPIPELEGWRRAFDGSELHRLTLRFRLDRLRRPIRAREPVGSWNLPVTDGPPVCIALERMAGPHRLVVQLVEPLAEEHVQPLMQVIAPLSSRIDRIEVQDLGGPEHVADRQRRALRALSPMFARVLPSVGPLLSP